MDQLDPAYMAIIRYQRMEYDECIQVCTTILEKNPYDEAIWSLKTRALTAQVRVDDIEADEEGIVDVVLDDNAIQALPRPGTSIRTAAKTGGGGTTSSQAYRPTSQSGRPLSGVARPGSVAGRPTTMGAALTTPRTARTARPVSATSGRFVRLGTASMLSQPDGPFINLARLNLGKYAARPNLAKALFEYILYHENLVREAMDLASQALQASKYEDWFWKEAMGKCYFRLGLFRDAEGMFKSALKQQETIDLYLALAKVYLRLDQPLGALEVYTSAVDRFPGDVSLLTGMARIHEGLGDMALSKKCYLNILQEEPINVEAIACIGMNHFYADQPELSLRFYRRLLQMGVSNAELYNNLGLCCFYAQQYDMSLTCMERALAFADEEETKAEIWYNVGHIALAMGDTSLAYQCYRLALVSNNSHCEAFNNLGVLEMRRGNAETSRALFNSAASSGPHLFEPNYNLASLASRTGDLQTSYVVVKKSLATFPLHFESNELLSRLNSYFSLL